MNEYLPEDFDCPDSMRPVIIRKLAALESASEDIPVFVVHDVRNFSVVYMSVEGRRRLGYSLAELREMGEAYFTRFFSPDDVSFYLAQFMELIRSPQSGQWFSYFQKVSTGNAGSMEYYLSASRLFMSDEKGQPMLALTLALPLAPDHHLTEKAGRIMEEDLILKEGYQRYASLTKREKELLRYIAAGETARETSCRMFISEKTIQTHRRNIKRKLGVRTHYDLVKFAQAFNLV